MLTKQSTASPSLPTPPAPPHSREECPSWPHSHWAWPRQSLGPMDVPAGVTCDATGSRVLRHGLPGDVKPLPASRRPTLQTVGGKTCRVLLNTTRSHSRPTDRRAGHKSLWLQATGFGGCFLRSISAAKAGCYKPPGLPAKEIVAPGARGDEDTLQRGSGKTRTQRQSQPLPRWEMRISGTILPLFNIL